MRRLTRISLAISDFTGSGAALVGIGALVALWLVWGVVGGWSRAWEITMFATAPILTLVLLVFLQHTQNRHSQVTHLKLNELLLALDPPNSDVATAEEKSDDDLQQLADDHRKTASSEA